MGKFPQGVLQVASAVSASQKRAPMVSKPTRRGLRRTKRSCTNIASTATVRTLSGQKNRSEWMLFIAKAGGGFSASLRSA